VRVGHDEPHPRQAARPQGAQEARPEGAVLGVAHVEPEDLALAARGHPRGHDDGLGDDRRPVVGLDVGGVEEEVGEGDVVEGPLPEAADHAVELAADAGHLALADAGLDAEGGHEVVDLACRDAVDVGLHDDRPEGLVDAPAGLEEGREEAALAQLGDAQLDVPGLRGEQAGARAVAVGGAGLAPLIAPRADGLAGLQIDEPLGHQEEGLADEVQAVAGADGLEQLGQGRL
jgi:hypothetical protein